MLRSVLFISGLLFCSALRAQHVYYGEHALSDSTLSIYLDKEGFPYPDFYIADSSMEEAGGSLLRWMFMHASSFKTICGQYNYFPDRTDSISICTLRDSIFSNIARRIIAHGAAFPAIAFYIHGFRKSFHPVNSDVPSTAEFELLRRELQRYGGMQPLEVCVYWDGMYDCCFSLNRKRNAALFDLFTVAAGQARRTGYELRRLFSLLPEEKPVQVIAHSLGAQVTAHLLFNTQPQPSETLPTPTQRLSVCLIAPAAGAALFHHYGNRTPINATDATDRYRLLIVYNEQDFVLLKKDPKTGLFGPGVHRYGETGLGCNYRHSAEQLRDYFSQHFPHSEIQLLDKSILGKCHSLRCYAQDNRLTEVHGFLQRGF